MAVGNLIKLGIIGLLILIPNAYAQYGPETRITHEAQHPLQHKADRIRVDTDGFNNQLDGTVSNVQLALDKLDDRITDDYPLTPTTTGDKGELAYSSDYLYVAIDTDTWRRTRIYSWVYTHHYLKIDGTNYLLIDATNKLYID